VSGLPNAEGHVKESQRQFRFETRAAKPFEYVRPGSCHPRLSRKMLTCVLLAVVSRPSLPATDMVTKSTLVSRANMATGLPWQTDCWHRARGRRRKVHECSDGNNEEEHQGAFCASRRPSAKASWPASDRASVECVALMLPYCQKKKYITGVRLCWLLPYQARRCAWGGSVHWPGG
jgi:hypothetical protein